MVWPNSGQANGTDGDLVVLAPPYIVSEEEIQEIAGRLTTALNQVRCET
jgi:adenosylmethionine-8-amino-7-oxononanoate aminotransferase